MMTDSLPRILFFPGSFNPFTPGHADIVERALQISDKVVIGIGYNIDKPAGDVEIRAEAIRAIYQHNDSIDVVTYGDLTVDAAIRAGACAIVRGVRSFIDFEYEMNMAEVNRRLAGIDTIILPAKPELAYVSSSIIRELERYGRKL